MSVRTAACLFFFLTTFRVCDVYKLLRLNFLCIFAQIQQISLVFCSFLQLSSTTSLQLSSFLYCLKTIVNFFISSSVVSSSFLTYWCECTKLLQCRSPAYLLFNSFSQSEESYAEEGGVKQLISDRFYLIRVEKHNHSHTCQMTFLLIYSHVPVCVHRNVCYSVHHCLLRLRLCSYFAG